MSDCSFLWSPGTYGTGADPEAGARASLRHQSVRGGVWWHGDINLLFLHTPRCRGPCNARRGAAQCCTAQHSASGRTALLHFVSQSGTFNYLAKSIVRRVAVGMRGACPTAPFFLVSRNLRDWSRPRARGSCVTAARAFGGPSARSAGGTRASGAASGGVGTGRGSVDLSSGVVAMCEFTLYTCCLSNMVPRCTVHSAQCTCRCPWSVRAGGRW